MRLAIFILVYLLSGPVQSQSVQFSAEMNNAVKFFDQATNAKDYLIVLAKLEPIAKANPTEWLPFYYMSLVKIRMSMLKMGDADQLANQSIDLIEKAKQIQVNDEILCAESLAYTAKMTVSPYTRWLRLESKIKNPLSLAKKMNKDNPRIYALEASLQYHMPVLLGGGCGKSFSVAQVASDKLNAQSKTNTVYYMPHWGVNIIKDIVDNCK